MYNPPSTPASDDETATASFSGRQYVAVGYVRMAAYPHTARDRMRLDDQRVAIRAYAKRSNLRLKEIFRDIGFSADEYRPGVAEILKAARGGKFQVLVVANQSRLGRGLPEVKAVLQALEACGVQVHDVAGRQITFSGNSAEMTLVRAMFDELELTALRERAQTCAGNVPLGYAVKRGRGLARRYIHSPDAGLVRTIVRRTAAGESPAATAAELRKGRHRKAGRPTPAPVFLGGEAPIVEPKVWKAANTLLNRCASSRSRNRRKAR